MPGERILPGILPYSALQEKEVKTMTDIIIQGIGGRMGHVLCDLIARSLFAPTELSISSVTAVFGAPVVIYMMVRRKAGRE